MFRLVRPLPRALLEAEYGYEAFGDEDVDAAFEHSLRLSPRDKHPSIRAAKVRLLIETGDTARARAELGRCRSEGLSFETDLGLAEAMLDERGPSYAPPPRRQSRSAQATAPAECDLAVVGGGILGLAVARELKGRHPELETVVLEAADRVGTGQTGRNSGVIHAGIYYAPGSLKARMCVAGAARLYELCERRGIAHERCGKLIVARDESELGRLDELERRGPRERRARPAQAGCRGAEGGGAELRGRVRAALARTRGSWTSPRWRWRSLTISPIRACPWSRAAA